MREDCYDDYYEQREEPVRNMDKELTPDQVHDARRRSLKRDRLNTIYLILREVKGRKNAIHACEIIARAKDNYGIEDITANDITECVNRLVDMDVMPDIQSEKKKGYYRATNMTEFKVGLYEIAMTIKGYMNRWDNRRKCFEDMFGMGIIPYDPFDYKEEIGEELNNTETL